MSGLISDVLLRPAVLFWSFGLSLALFVGSLVAMPILLGRLRADYFARPDAANAGWLRRHTLVRVLLLAVKNLLGLVLLAAGLAMMVLPGQGIITILIALTLLNFPGRRRLELRLIRQRHVRSAVDWIRRRAGSPPLIVPEPGARPRAQDGASRPAPLARR